MIASLIFKITENGLMTHILRLHDVDTALVDSENTNLRK